MIYDPVREELLEDITYRLINNKEVKCTPHLRLEAMSCISQLRNLVRVLAPPGSQAHQTVRSSLMPSDFKMVYWTEYAAEEYRKIEARKRAEETAIEWLGA